MNYENHSTEELRTTDSDAANLDGMKKVDWFDSHGENKRRDYLLDPSVR